MAGDLDDEEDDEMVASDQQKRKVTFEPSPGMSTPIQFSATFPINALYKIPRTPFTTEVIG